MIGREGEKENLPTIDSLSQTDKMCAGLGQAKARANSWVSHVGARAQIFLSHFLLLSRTH